MQADPRAEAERGSDAATTAVGLAVVDGIGLCCVAASKEGHFGGSLVPSAIGGTRFIAGKPWRASSLLSIRNDVSTTRSWRTVPWRGIL